MPIYIKAAYRLVPVHQQNCHLLAMKWEERVYVNTALAFGLQSAPELFNTLAEAQEWYTKEQVFSFCSTMLTSRGPYKRAGVRFCSSLDDYIAICQAGTGECVSGSLADGTS